MLAIILTGVRSVQTSQVTVTIGGTDLSGDAITYVGPTGTPGFDQINVTLPGSLAGVSDVPVVVTTTASAATASRSSDQGAPGITIQ
jgi:uncharacterized protein (TIGR03437 family)